MGKRKPRDESSGCGTPYSKRRKPSSTNKHHPSSRTNSLPIETLEKILLQYLSSVPTQDYYSSLRLLRLVCPRWSACIAEAPVFWSFVDPALGTSHINMVAKRSGTIPLTVCDSGPDWGLRSLASFPNLFNYSRRWRSVRLRLRWGFWMSIRGDAGSDEPPMDTLKHLDLAEYGDADRSNEAHPMHGLNTPFLPHLSVLHLTRHVPSSAWLLLLLAHCPSLAHITLRPYIRREVSDPGSTTSEIVELLHMETMDINYGDPSFAAALLRGLRTPSCTSKVLRFEAHTRNLQVFRHRLLTSLREVVEFVSILEFQKKENETVEIQMQTDDGIVLLIQMPPNHPSIAPLVAWLVDLTNGMPHLRSTRIDYHLASRGTKEAFDPGQPLWSLPKVTELCIRVSELWGVFPDRTTKETILSALGNPGPSGEWLLPDLTKLSIKSKFPRSYRMVDLRNFLKSRYSRRDDGKDPPKPLEELRVTVWRKQTKTFEEIEAIVERDRFVKMQIDA